MNTNISSLRKSAQIRLTDKLDAQPEILKIGDEVVATIGNISASIGKAKAKKSFNLLAMMAAAIMQGEPSLKYLADLPLNKRKILYVDTEQSKFHCLLSFTRLARMAKLSLDVHPEVIEFLGLRRFSIEKRIAIINDAIVNTKGLGIVCIDGIRDLVADINDSSQANWIIGQLMEWTETYNIHCHVVLHQNKGDGNARGHLGTELVNKSETVIEIAKESDGKNSLVKPLFCRNKEFLPFRFYINEDGLPELNEDVSEFNRCQNSRFSYEELREEEHRGALARIFKDESSLGYGRLIKKLQDEYSVYFQKGLGANRAKSLKVFLQNKRLIIQDGKGYKFNSNSVF